MASGEWKVKYKTLGYLFVIFALISVVGEVRAFEAPVYRLGLEELITLALRNNEEIKAAHYDVYAAIAKKIEATKHYVPVVKYRYRVAPVPRDLNDAAGSFFSGDVSVFNSIKIEAGIPLTTFGKLTVAQELADIGIDASKLKKQQKADEVALDIYKLYHGVLLARELLALGQKGLEAVNSKIEELEKAETTDQLQILKLKAVLYQVEKRLDEARKKQTVALAMLKFRAGLEDDARLVLKDTYLKREHFPQKSYEELLRLSKERRPEYRLLAYQVYAKKRQVHLEKTEYYPKLILGGFFEYGVSPGIRNNETVNDFTNPFNFTRAGVGFELTSDLDIRKIKSKVAVAKAEYLKAIAEKRSNYRLLEIDLKNAFLDMIQKRNQLWRAEREQRSARQIVFLTKSNMDVGLAEKKEYLDALQSYLLIQAAVYQNIFDYNVAVATVRQKVGALYNKELLEGY